MGEASASGVSLHHHTEFGSEPRKAESPLHSEILDWGSWVPPRDAPQAWLLAPSRGGSLERFLSVARSFRVRRGLNERNEADLSSTKDEMDDAVGGYYCPFSVHSFKSFDPVLDELERKAKENPDYKTDIHSLILVCLVLT